MSDADSELSRDLGYVGATAIGLGAMIGGGIFILPSIVARQAGPASMLSFAIAGFLSLLAALSHAELATDMPKAGGGYQYVNHVLGPLWGSMVGWSMWVGLLFANAFYVVGFARYLTYFAANLPITLTATVLTVVLIGVNYIGVSEASWVQNTIVGSLLVLLIVFVGVGLIHVDRDLLTPFAPEGPVAIIETTGTVYVALIGFALIATAAGEIRQPERNIPRSMLTAVLVPTVLYVLVMVVSTGVVPIAVLAGSRVPVAEVATVFLGSTGGLAMVVGAVLATVSSANASILSAGRVSFAMSRNRALIDWFNETHERYNTPHRTLLISAVGILLLLVTDVPLNLLAEMASFAFLTTYGLVHVALIRIRRDDTLGYDPDFKIPDWLYPQVPVIGVVSTVGIMSQMEPIVIAGGAGLLGFGAVWYLSYVEQRGLRPQGLRTK